MIGAGVAGLVFALQCAERFKVHILCKGQVMECNTGLAQGGIAAALAWPDESEKHIQDTLQVGCGLCDEEAVRFLINQAADAIEFLEKEGMPFQRKQSGDYDLALEAAHSMPRVLHVRDQTGSVLMQTLLKAIHHHPRIEISENCYVDQLLMKEGHCIGASYFQNEAPCHAAITASATMLATGGIGQLYAQTSNSLMATGDGIALAYEAGARLRDMEFIQFHPTLLYSPSKKPFLISEALRGAGAIVCDQDGYPFLNDLHREGSLAPRDFISQAIFQQMQSSRSDHVYLDLRKHWTEKNKSHFAAIAQRCSSEGIDPKVDLIPVLPAAHYLCGGIACNLYGQTNISGLLVSGENACTGVHGANRLASNSLLESVVFSLSSARKLLVTRIPNISLENISSRYCYSDGNQETNYVQTFTKLQHIMSQEVGIVRTIEGLEKAETILQTLWRQLMEEQETLVNRQQLQLKQSLRTALIIVKAALNRKESIGTHFIQSGHLESEITTLNKT